MYVNQAVYLDTVLFFFKVLLKVLG